MAHRALIHLPHCHAAKLKLKLELTNVTITSFFSTLCRHPTTTLPPQPPPSPKKLPFTVSVHGRTWEDPYHWMSNTDDPHLLEHLNRENIYADAFMADTLKLRSQLSSEMKARLPPSICTPPERWGPWLYYQYIPEGKEYPVMCRKLETEQSGWMNTFLHRHGMAGSKREEVLLDWNELADSGGARNFKLWGQFSTNI